MNIKSKKKALQSVRGAHFKPKICIYLLKISSQYLHIFVFKNGKIVTRTALYFSKAIDGFFLHLLYIVFLISLRNVLFICTDQKDMITTKCHKIII